ncbi:hypothetical protein WJX82_004029 [Trebouxia sp. C0006]
MAALAASQALQSRSAYFPGDSEGDASSSTTVNTSASQPRRTQDAAPPSSHSNPVISRASFASASRHKSAQVQTSSAVRAWRFPSSRRFLWDRSATGPCVHLHPQAFLPAVILRQQAFKSLQEQTGAAKQLHLPAAWHVGVSNAVSLAVGAGPSDIAEATFSLPIVQGQKELHECCFGDSALELAQHLTAAVESGLNVRAPASMQQVYSVSCHSNAAQLHCQVAVPGASVLLTPLYAKKVCQVPLSQSLQDSQQQAMVKASQNGLLSMDQARSLLPLLADDPNAYGVPLVGVWVSGVASPTHPLVWLACLKFFATSQLQDKVTQGDQAFLLLLYPAGSHPSCYEVRVDAPSQKMPVLSLRCAASRPGKGDAVCSLVPMRHADNSIDVSQGHSSREAAEASRPSSSQSWRSPSLSKDVDQLAPRRQSLPVPHASPAFVPAWAPQGPDTHSHTSSPNRPYHVDTQTAVQFSAGMEEAGRAGPEGDAQGVQQATEAGVDTAALQKEVTELRQQLQRLMLQMAANAAAPPARPSRTAETTRSLSWSQPAAGDSPLASQPSSDVRSSVAGSLLMHQIEPATPPASFQREESGAGAGAAQQTTIAWEGYPQVGAQWGFKQETIQVGTVTADSHMPIKLSQVTNQDQQSSAPVPSDRSGALHGGAELDPLAPPSDQEGAPLLLTSASPQKPLQHRTGTVSTAASAASSLAANSMLLSGSGTGMMTVVRTQFVPLGDSLSDSDSDSEDTRLEQKYGIIRGCRRKSSMAVSHRDSSSSFLPDMSLDSRMYLHMHGVWQPSMNSLAVSEDLHPD